MRKPQDKSVRKHHRKDPPIPWGFKSIARSCAKCEREFKTTPLRRMLCTSCFRLATSLGRMYEYSGVM